MSCSGCVLPGGDSRNGNRNRRDGGAKPPAAPPPHETDVEAAAAVEIQVSIDDAAKEGVPQ